MGIFIMILNLDLMAEARLMVVLHMDQVLMAEALHHMEVLHMDHQVMVVLLMAEVLMEILIMDQVIQIISLKFI
jgi:hypothetical protein